MGKLIMAAILAAAVYFGYQWIWISEPTEVASNDNSGDEAVNFAEDPADSGGEAAASLDDPEDGDVPADFSVALKDAEATWEQYAADKGGDATLHAQAPSLAATYSKLLQQTYNKPALKKIQLQLVKRRLTPLAERIFFSSKSYKDDKSGLLVYHEIKSGERLDNIGREYGMSWEFINIMRGKKPNDEVYRPGEILKLINAKQQGYLLHIDKDDFYMDIYARGVFVKRYAIGHGAHESETPTGETFIEAREKYPQWTDPKTNQVYLYGQEGHILGPVWLAFSKEIGKSGLGIHGYTGDGQATGVLASNGCIRMKNEEALELYYLMVKTSKGPPFITRAPMKVRIVE